jgi:large subunit ribosomal protein L6
MSRIGKLPILIPGGVTVKVDGSAVTVKGPRGQVSRTFHPDIEIRQEDGSILVERPSDEQAHRALHGLTRALLANMVSGVSDGFVRELEIEGTGYRADQEGKTLVLLVGYSHPVRIEPPEGVSFAVENRGKKVVVTGIDKEAVGHAAVLVRRVRPPEPYKGKGIRYAGEQIRRKAGKAGKAR